MSVSWQQQRCRRKGRGEDVSGTRRGRSWPRCRIFAALSRLRGRGRVKEKREALEPVGRKRRGLRLGAGCRGVGVRPLAELPPGAFLWQRRSLAAPSHFLARPGIPGAGRSFSSRPAPRAFHACTFFSATLRRPACLT